MGNQHGKKQSKPRPSNRRSQSVLEFVENDGGAISQSVYDDMEIIKLETELKETPQIFVLNNMLMSLMFFENYERENQALLHSSVTTMEKELNPTLLREETIECVIPDVVFESVHKNVQYQSIHGPKKEIPVPLVPRRLYVVNDNIEVLESTDTPQYSAIDKPRYQVHVEESGRSGYVKLKCVERQARLIVANTSQQPTNVNLPGPSNQSDDLYEYSTITAVNTPKPLNIENYERRDTLPKSCFSARRIKKYEEDSDSEEEEEAIKAEELYETIYYISSNGFMTHFQNAVFPNSLGRALGFDQESIQNAVSIPGKIFCNLEDVEDFRNVPCEIVPSVAMLWPMKLTYEFDQRSERPIMWDKFGKSYRWPSSKMIEEIKALNCVIIPRGFIQKRGENLDSEIEWEVAFPKAERYLDTHMSHSQLKSLFFLVTICNTYIEPKTKRLGLLVEHIRNHIYWECESNPRDWPEHRLGTRLVSVIQNLIDRLAVSTMPDFFIKRKNVLENVPNKYLKHAQKVFHEVLETPAVFFIGALRNLRYTNSRFYPSFDFRKLYMILTTDNVMKMVNSNVNKVIPPNFQNKRRNPGVQGDHNYRMDVNWKYKREKRNREIFLKKQQQEKDKKENLKPERKVSVDSINYEWQCEEQFELIKNREILTFFINHFIEMARTSRRFSGQRQTLLFLKQAFYLAKILENLNLKSDAAELLRTIEDEEIITQEQSMNEHKEDGPPITPQRNSLQFNWDITQQVKGININLNNINKSYNKANITSQPSFKKMRQPSLGKSVLMKQGLVQEERRKSLEVKQCSIEESSM